MTKRTIITVGTWKYSRTKHTETIDEISMTKPGEAYTIQELFRRSAAGLGLNIHSNYLQEGSEDAQFDDIDMEKLSKMDIFDSQEVVKSVQEKFDKAKARQEFLKNKEEEEKETQEKKIPDKEIQDKNSPKEESRKEDTTE